MGGTRLVAVSALTVLLTSCSGGDGVDQGSREAVAVATEFHAHLDASEPAAACALLSPATRTELESSADTPCDRAVVQEAIPAPGDVRSASQYGSMAQVRFTNDVVFLSRYASGWLVVAAGCRSPASPDGVYDCSVKGV